MKTTEIKALETYFKTDNEHWNKYAFEMLCEVMQYGHFEDFELPLSLLNSGENVFIKHHETPLLAIQAFAEELDKKKLSVAQKLFVYRWVCKYLSETEYDELDLSPIRVLLERQRAKLKTVSEPKRPLVKNLRETLKEVVEKEFERLPATLNELEPAQRLNILCRLAAFVLPRIDGISHDYGER